MIVQSPKYYIGGKTYIIENTTFVVNPITSFGGKSIDSLPTNEEIKKEKQLEVEKSEWSSAEKYIWNKWDYYSLYTKGFKDLDQWLILENQERYLKCLSEKESNFFNKRPEEIMNIVDKHYSTSFVKDIINLNIAQTLDDAHLIVKRKDYDLYSDDVTRIRINGAPLIESDFNTNFIDSIFIDNLPKGKEIVEWIKETENNELHFSTLNTYETIFLKKCLENNIKSILCSVENSYYFSNNVNFKKFEFDLKEYKDNKILKIGSLNGVDIYIIKDFDSDVCYAFPEKGIVDRAYVKLDKNNQFEIFGKSFKKAFINSTIIMDIHIPFYIEPSFNQSKKIVTIADFNIVDRNKIKLIKMVK